jgi:hypothetical protein
MRNKRGWIKILEAFIAILLIAGVLLVVINKGYFERNDFSIRVYEAQIAVLREIELDDGLRTDILNSIGEVPESVLNKIKERIPDYLTCESKICDLNEICEINKDIEKDVYAQAVAITADLETYNPKQLKLFCWAG